MMLDTTEPINLTTYNRTVTVESHGSDLCLPVTSDRASISTICPNKHFVQVKLHQSSVLYLASNHQSAEHLAEYSKRPSICASASLRWRKQAGADQKCGASERQKSECGMPAQQSMTVALISCAAEEDLHGHVDRIPHGASQLDTA